MNVPVFGFVSDPEVIHFSLKCNSVTFALRLYDSSWSWIESDFSTAGCLNVAVLNPVPCSHKATRQRKVTF